MVRLLRPFTSFQPSRADFAADSEFLALSLGSSSRESAVELDGAADPPDILEELSSKLDFSASSCELDGCGSTAELDGPAIPPGPDGGCVGACGPADFLDLFEHACLGAPRCVFGCDLAELDVRDGESGPSSSTNLCSSGVSTCGDGPTLFAGRLEADVPTLLSDLLDGCVGVKLDTTFGTLCSVELDEPDASGCLVGDDFAAALGDSFKLFSHASSDPVTGGAAFAPNDPLCLLEAPDSPSLCVSSHTVCSVSLLASSALLLAEALAKRSR